MSLPDFLPPNIQLDDKGLLARAVPLMEFDWLRHGCTTRHFSPPDANRAFELQHLRAYLELPESTPVFHAEQKHTATVQVVEREHLEQLKPDGRFVFGQTDAIVCPLAGVMIAVLTADCAPVFFVDPVKRVIALAHAGWKGTFGRIVQNTVYEMSQVGCAHANIIAWVGPMIGGCCYEVSPEMVEQFAEEFRFATERGITLAEGRKLDLVSLNAWQLQDAGLSPSNIYTSGVCTLDQKATFYSYRGDNGTTGRIISAMAMDG